MSLVDMSQAKYPTTRLASHRLVACTVLLLYLLTYKPCEFTTASNMLTCASEWSIGHSPPALARPQTEIQNSPAARPVAR